MFGIYPFPLISILSYSVSYFVQFQCANIANLIEYTLVIKHKSDTYPKNVSHKYDRHVDIKKT